MPNVFFIRALSLHPVLGGSNPLLSIVHIHNSIPCLSNGPGASLVFYLLCAGRNMFVKPPAEFPAYADLVYSPDNRIHYTCVSA